MERVHRLDDLVAQFCRRQLAAALQTDHHALVAVRLDHGAAVADFRHGFTHLPDLDRFGEFDLEQIAAREVDAEVEAASRNQPQAAEHEERRDRQPDLTITHKRDIQSHFCSAPYLRA